MKGYCFEIGNDGKKHIFKGDVMGNGTLRPIPLPSLCNRQETNCMPIVVLAEEDDADTYRKTIDAQEQVSNKMCEDCMNELHSIFPLQKVAPEGEV